MNSVLQHLARHRKQAQEELAAFVRFPSVSAQPAHKKDLQACARWLLDHCRSIGLRAALHQTPGHPVLIATTPPRPGPPRPRFLVYGHYDVQPPEPFELWKTPPFEPVIRKGALYGRGASDNKGQHLAHLKAVEAYLRTGTELPVDLVFLIEGEEEVGSSHLPSFLARHRRQLACEAVVISDNCMPAKSHPSLTYALRGILALEVRLDGPSRDLHSGIYGGALDNPAMALCQLLAQLRDPKGRIAIPGFYDAVVELTAYERKQLRRVPANNAALRRFFGVPRLFGEAGYSPLEQRTSRPTLEINGLTSGYQGDGSKTIVPAWASAKLTIRLVPNQDPAHIARLAQRHLRKLCPPTVRLTVHTGHGGQPYLVSPTGPFARAATRAIELAFNRPAVLNREGGSIPIVNEFRRQLGADTLLIGLALPDDNPHSPNEKFDLDCFHRGARMSAHLWQELAAAHKPA